MCGTCDGPKKEVGLGLQTGLLFSESSANGRGKN